MKDGIRVCSCQLPQIKSDVEIQRIGALPRHLQVLRPLTQALHGHGQSQWDFGLAGPHKNHQVPMRHLQVRQRLRLHALEINQHHVFLHRYLLVCVHTECPVISIFVSRSQ